MHGSSSLFKNFFLLLIQLVNGCSSGMCGLQEVMEALLFGIFEIYLGFVKLKVPSYLLLTLGINK